MNYKRIAQNLIQKYRDTPDGLEFKFEKYHSTYPERVLLLILYVLSKSRPTNRTLIESGRSLSSNNEMCSARIRRYFRDMNRLVMFSHQWEERSMKLSYATRLLNNPASKGIIIAIDIETYRSKWIYGLSDIVTFGFHPPHVYDILTKDNRFTHRGHVFIREREVEIEA